MNLHEELKNIAREESDKRTKPVLERIKDHAKKGKNSMTYFDCDPLIFSGLKREGFQVEKIKDFRDGDYLKITW